MIDLSQYDVSQATHNIQCCHAMNSVQMYYYTMPCLFLGLTKRRNARVVVFGYRYWLNRSKEKRLRYVPMWRLKPRA